VASAVLNVSQQPRGLRSARGAWHGGGERDPVRQPRASVDRSSLTAGFATAFEWAMVLALIGFVLSVALIRRRSPELR
jgi:hypothetical protein